MNVGGPEILVILIVALVVLGPERLPDAARTVGRVVGEVRRMASGFEAEVRDAMREPPPATGQPPAVSVAPESPPPPASELPPEPSSPGQSLASGPPTTSEGNGSPS